MAAVVFAGLLAANVQLFLLIPDDDASSSETSGVAPAHTLAILSQAASPAVAGALRTLESAIAGQGSATLPADLAPLEAHLRAAAYCYDQGLCDAEAIRAHACRPLGDYEAVLAEAQLAQGARYQDGERALSRTMLWKDCESAAQD
ncbi:hypothetical protein P2H44_05110 [Albimonas sp. CAU 1670]|uniref:hypothetical protein n=1 Tax=Albimonas sp. CAU 1670 TaxID=3032599 RepID=UPI0023DA3F42|nr:hypothetical protein [Albimonas sp. CAU 1670]MDF2231925.1 hypothetical protein [Albimonas sp. CAU 1670]